MLPSTTKLFSADDHIIEHPNVWLDRLPARFRDRAPRIIDVNGRDVWKFEDELVEIQSGSCRVLDGVPPNQFRALR